MSKEYRVERKGISQAEINEMMAAAGTSPAGDTGIEIKGVPPHLRGQQQPGEFRPGQHIPSPPSIPPAAPYSQPDYQGIRPSEDHPPPMPSREPSRPQSMNQLRTSSYAPNDPEYERVMGLLLERQTKYEEITLPSRGRFYDGTNGPHSGVIHIRPMSGTEEQILATPRYVKKGKALDMIFRECIAEKQFDPANLLTLDRTFLLVYLRGISYTADYDVEVKCPHCTTSFSTVIDLNLPIEQCPDDFGPHSLEDMLPSSGFKFTYRLSTGIDENLVTDHRERRVKDWGDQAADDTLTFRASLLVTSIEGVRGQPMIQALLQRLPINDVAYIRNLVNEPPFGVKTQINIICPSCSEEFDVEMPLEAHFFFPRRKKEKRKN